MHVRVHFPALGRTLLSIASPSARTLPKSSEFWYCASYGFGSEFVSKPFGFWHGARSVDSADSGGFRWTSARAIGRPLIRTKIIRILARGILWIRVILRDFVAFGRPPCEPPVAFEFASNSSGIWSGASYGFG